MQRTIYSVWVKPNTWNNYSSSWCKFNIYESLELLASWMNFSHNNKGAPCLHSNSTRGFTRNTWHMGTQSCLFKMLQMHSSKYILSQVNNIWSVTPPQRSWVKKAGQLFLNRKVLTQRNSPHSEDSSKKPCSLITLVASNWKFCQRLTSHQCEASVVVMHRLSFEKQLSSK